jgi:hypothetical protein
MLPDERAADIQYSQEERIVAELAFLGVRYLSRRTPDRAKSVRPPAVLLADLVRHPSARVRLSVIAVLLAHPAYAHSPHERLIALGQRHRQQSGANVNWFGTCENVTRHLLRSWELQAQWSQ